MGKGYARKTIASEKTVNLVAMVVETQMPRSLAYSRYQDWRSNCDCCYWLLGSRWIPSTARLNLTNLGRSGPRMPDVGYGNGYWTVKSQSTDHPRVSR
jgi:hypothetical protein